MLECISIAVISGFLHTDVKVHEVTVVKQNCEKESRYVLPKFGNAQVKLYKFDPETETYMFVI